MLNKNNITEGIIWKQMLKFFFPILIGAILQQLYNTVDTIIVGKYVGTQALAAVGTTYTITNLLIGAFIGLSSGATVIISQYYGAKDDKNVSKAVHTSIALAIVGGILLMIIGLSTAKLTLELLNAPENVLNEALIYLNTYYLGMISCLVYNIGTGILRAIGNSKTPLYILLGCSCINIVLDIIFIAFLKMGVFGAALATIIAQTISAIIVTAKLIFCNESYRIQIKQIRLHVYTLKKILYIGIPAALQSVLYSISYLFVQASVNSFGMNAIAAWTAVSKIDGFIWMMMRSFGTTAITFSSQNFGAQKYDRLKKSINTCLFMTVFSIAGISIFLLVFSEPLLHIFTSDSSVIEVGKEFIYILGPFFWVFGFVEVLAGAIQGSGEAIPPVIINCICTCVLRTLWLFLLVPQHHTIKTLAWNYPVTWAVPAIIFIIYYGKMNWLKRCIHKNTQ